MQQTDTRISGEAKSASATPALGTRFRPVLFVTLFSLLLPFLLNHVSAYAQEFTYESGPLDDLTSWTGDPQSFEEDGQTFIITGIAIGDTVSVENTWTLGGEGTVLEIDTEEVIVFESGSEVIFDGITISFTENSGGDLAARGDLSLSGGITWQYGDKADVWSFDNRADGDQTISADGESRLLVYNFRSDKRNGSLDLMFDDDEPATSETPAILQTLNNFRTDYDSNALFSDNGNRIIVGDDIRMLGRAGSYTLSGTLEHRVHDGNSDYEAVAAELHHLSIHVREDGNPRFRNVINYSKSVIINGDLAIDMDSDGDFEFNDVEIEIAGDFHLSHHRPAGTSEEDDAEVDMDEAVISIGGDFIVHVTKEVADDDENIDMDDAVVTVGGDFYVNATEYGEFDLDDSSVSVTDGYARFEATDGGIIDLDNGSLTVNSDILFVLDETSELDLDDAIVAITGSISIDAELATVITSDELTVRYFGDGDQTISSLEGRHYHTLEIEKSNGTISIPENIIVSDLFLATLDEDALLADEGNDIRIGNWFTVSGHNDRYDLQGTVTMSEIPPPVDESIDRAGNPGSNNRESTGRQKTVQNTTGNDEGEITLTYQQTTPRAVQFDLFILPEPDTDPGEITQQFTLAEINETNRSSVSFSEESPVFMLRQHPDGYGGQVILSELSWLLPGDPRTTDSEPEPDRPETFRLEQNYPNPFNPATNISFSIPEAANVTMEVFNIQGQRVATLVDGNREPGIHEVSFDASSLSSGMYIYRIQAGEFVDVRKMMLVR